MSHSDTEFNALKEELEKEREKNRELVVLVEQIAENVLPLKCAYTLYNSLNLNKAIENICSVTDAFKNK